MRLKIVAIIVFAALLFVGCSSDNEAENTNTTDIKELVRGYTVGSLEAASASITSAELIVTSEDQTETTYDLPDDEFFVSIAPFIKDTHP